jgi:hypothetical protein
MGQGDKSPIHNPVVWVKKKNQISKINMLRFVFLLAQDFIVLGLCSD